MIKRVASILAAFTFAANGAMFAIADDSNIDTLEIAEENKNESTSLVESKYSESETDGLEKTESVDENDNYIFSKNVSRFIFDLILKSIKEEGFIELKY